MSTPTQFTAWHLESWGYRRSPDNPNHLVHIEAGKPGCLFHPITLTSDLNDGQCVLAVLRALDAMHRERIKELGKKVGDHVKALAAFSHVYDARMTAVVPRHLSAALSAGQKGAGR